MSFLLRFGKYYFGIGLFLAIPVNTMNIVINDPEIKCMTPTYYSLIFPYTIYRVIQDPKFLNRVFNNNVIE